MISATETHSEPQTSTESVIGTYDQTDIIKQSHCLYYSSNWRNGVRLRPSDRWAIFYKNRKLGCSYPGIQIFRAQVGTSDDIGAYARLTNSYSLIGGQEVSDKFYSDVLRNSWVPVIKTSLGGCRTIGCMCVGNKHGLILPDTVYDTELEQIKERIPDSVEIKIIEERLSALGNVVVCNDNVAIVHPELDKESEEVIADTLQVEIFRCLIGNSPLVGSYCVLNNKGGLLSTDMNNAALKDLSSLLELPLFTGTINGGKKIIASCLAANDNVAYAGPKTTGNEFNRIDEALGAANLFCEHKN